MPTCTIAFIAANNRLRFTNIIITRREKSSLYNIPPRCKIAIMILYLSLSLILLFACVHVSVCICISVCVCIFFMFLLLYSQVSLSCPYTRTDKFKYFTRTNFGVTSLADNYYYYYHYLLFINIVITNSPCTRSSSPARKNDLCSLSLSHILAIFSQTR